MSMTVQRAIARIKAAGHDISDEYSSDSCIEFINTAIQQVAALLISARFPSLIKEMTVHNGDSLPQNFMIAAGSYPLRMTNGRVDIIDDDIESVRFRFFATPDMITAETTNFPISHDAINEVIVKLAIMLALNENEYDISQDTTLTTALQQAIASGMQ